MRGKKREDCIGKKGKVKKKRKIEKKRGEKVITFKTLHVQAAHQGI